MLSKFKLIIVFSLISLINSPAQVGEFSIETITKITRPKADNLKQRLPQQIDDKFYDVHVYNDSVVFIDVFTKEQTTRDLTTLGPNRHLFHNIRFLTLNTCVIINRFFEQINIYNLETKEKTLIDLKPYLLSGEHLSTPLNQHITIIDNKVVVPLLDHNRNHENINLEKDWRVKPMFLLYDLESGIITRPCNQIFWPSNYCQKLTYEDFIPRFSTGNNNTLFLYFRHSNQIIEYNIKKDKAEFHIIPKLDYLPEADSLSHGTMGQRRQFHITNASIRNHLYNPILKKHFVFVKNKSPFIINDRIVDYPDIDWKLYVLDEYFNLEDVIDKTMDEFQWYGVKNFNESVIVFSYAKDSKGEGYITLKAITK